MSYLVLVRHGESVWNEKGLWTGLTDVPLDQKGIYEARKAAILIKDIPFDIAFTSDLRRAKETLEQITLELKYESLPVEESAALNERDYGDLTGKNKWEAEKTYGEEQFLKWRRGWKDAPPNGESLKMVYQRAVPYYQNHIEPLLKASKNVLISAHGNSLRALIKYLEDISDEKIPDLELKTGEVYVYTTEETGKIKSREIRR